MFRYEPFQIHRDAKALSGQAIACLLVGNLCGVRRIERWFDLNRYEVYIAARPLKRNANQREKERQNAQRLRLTFQEYAKTCSGLGKKGR